MGCVNLQGTDIFPYVLFNNNETYKFLYYPNNGLY